MKYHFVAVVIKPSSLGANFSTQRINNELHGDEPLLRSRQMCSYSRISQHNMESEGSLRSQEPSTGLYRELDQSIPCHFNLYL
jgi:hypothetical protein